MRTLIDEFLSTEIIDTPSSPNDTRQRIRDTTIPLYRWICSITPIIRHPDDPSREIEMTNMPGTGLLIGPRHVLTAAHVLYPKTINVRGGGIRTGTPAVKVKVAPGRNGSSKPFGEYVSNVFRFRPEWTPPNFSDSHDFALIVLPDPIGQQRFPAIKNNMLGWWGHCDHRCHMVPLDNTWLQGKTVFLSGYPQDKTLGEQWYARDVLNNSMPTFTPRGGSPVRARNMFTHVVDSCTGQSGAPVWWYDARCQKRFLVGVHTGSCDTLDGCRRLTGAGCVQGSSRFSHNRGVLLTAEVYNQIQNWLR